MNNTTIDVIRLSLKPSELRFRILHMGYPPLGGTCSRLLVEHWVGYMWNLWISRDAVDWVERAGASALQLGGVR